MPDATQDNQNIYLDFYTAPVRVDSEGDALDVYRYDIVKYWLTAKIRGQLKNDGVADIKDADYIMSLSILSDMIKTEVPAHSHKSIPKINGISY